jgi:hypothetical protein
MSGSGGESFLSRWGRRKREARAVPPPAETAPADESAAEAESAAPLETEPALSPEEVAALPPVETLTAESDFAAFLRKGVPEGLRLAALRRMWVLDPAIRDFVGDARDYSYDWNNIDSIPGFGSLTPGGDATAAVERAVETARQESSPPAESADERSRDAAQSEEVPPESEARSADADPSAVRFGEAEQPDTAERIGALPPDGSDSPGATGEGGDHATAVRPRRHGGARPV